MRDRELRENAVELVGVEGSGKASDLAYKPKHQEDSASTSRLH